MLLPWEPLFTVYRSGLPEVTIYGVLSVIDGQGKPLVALGDQTARLWTRSVLKPWQLLNHIHILKRSYPELRDEHYALMMASHNGEPFHEQVLDDILRLGGVDDSCLQNTPLYPIHPRRRIELRAMGKTPIARWGCCSGKHAGFVLAVKSEGGDWTNYLNKTAPHFVRMKRLLGWLLEESPQEIPETTDGCRLPNYAFTAPKIACLYQRLFWWAEELPLPEPDADIAQMMMHYNELHRIMRAYAEFMGGSERLDTELMQGRYTLDDVAVTAKEGADGVLAVGIAPCSKYPGGLGIAIKSSSGDDPRYFTTVIFELLRQLGLLRRNWVRENKFPHLRYEFHFNVKEPILQ